MSVLKKDSLRNKTDQYVESLIFLLIHLFLNFSKIQTKISVIGWREGESKSKTSGKCHLLSVS